MSFAISVQNVSKRYRLGEISRVQLFADLHRWWTNRSARSSEARGQPRIAEAEEKGDFWALKDISFELEQGADVCHHRRQRCGKINITENNLSNHGADDGACEDQGADRHFAGSWNRFSS